MKKFLVLIALVCLFMCTVEVDAACAYGANVGDEFVCLVAEATQGNSKGTAYPENGTLVLKNYNGGSISYSSGLGNPVAPVTIKLVGDNYIDSKLKEDKALCDVAPTMLEILGIEKPEEMSGESILLHN